MLYAFERLRRLSQNKRKGTGDLHGLTKFSLYRYLKIVDGIKIGRLGLADHVTRMVEDSIQKKKKKKFLMGNSTTQITIKTKNKMTDVVQRGALQMLEIRRRRSWRKRGMEAPLEGGKGLEEGV
jgi:hypothetical protein